MPSEVAVSHEGGGPFRLGDWLVQPSLNRLSRAGQTVQLEPRAMEVLAYLGRHAGRVIPREELIDAVWARQFVADATLSHAIATLRRALGDDPRQPRFIETISKRGYRLIAPRSSADEAAAAPPVETGRTARAAAPGVAGSPSVAVLPFLDMSPERNQAYFCDGVAEEIINALAQLEGLRVAARTSSFAFRGRLEDVREIGRQLAVETVLEGSVRKSGDRLRITVQLVDVADGYHLWSERFDRDGTDIFAIQDEISLGVVDRLKVALPAGTVGALGRRHAASREAYDLYLNGRYLLNRRRAGDLPHAIEYFERAAGVDAAYALPLVGIAEALSILGLWGFVSPGAAFGRAKAASSRALEIDGLLAEAHVWLAFGLLIHDWDWTAADVHFARALQLPHPEWTSQIGLALHHLAGGRPGDAVEAGLRGIEAEPLSPIAYTQAAAMLCGLGDFEAAVPPLERALQLDADIPMALLWLGFCRGVQGRLAAAADLLEGAADRGLTASLIALPAVLVRAGERQRGLAAIAALERTAAERYVSPIIRAFAWAALDDRERSLSLLAEAERERSPMFTMALLCPGYLALSPEWFRAWFARRRLEIGPGVSSA